MKLYHTSKVEIQTPDIHHGRRNADFGPGFYLTPEKEFACRWAGKNAVINIYELDTTDLDIHTFKRDHDWFRYIFDNRNAKDTVAADIVIGPIANDTIYDTLGILTSGLISDEDALRLLMLGPEYTQVAIKSERATGRLKWLGAEIQADNGKYAALLKEEQEAYRAQFDSEIEKIAEKM